VAIARKMATNHALHLFVARQERQRLRHVLSGGCGGVRCARFGGRLSRLVRGVAGAQHRRGRIHPVERAVGDFNGDGSADLLHVLPGANSVNVWLSSSCSQMFAGAKGGRPRIRSDARSATAITAALIWADGRSGKTDASTTRTPSMP
jgi:hypothetical protein